jgi:hypothetical protein
MQRDSPVTPASDGSTVLDQYGAGAGADGGEYPGSTPGRPSGILASTSIATTPSGPFPNGHGPPKHASGDSNFAVHAEPISHHPASWGQGSAMNYGAFPPEFNSGRRPTRYIRGRGRQHRARALRLVREHASDYDSEWAAMKAISGWLGMTAETVA